MSDSTPPNRNNASPPIPEYRTRWYFLSIALHLVAIAVLIFFTPIRQVLLEPEPPEPAAVEMAADQVERVAEIIEQVQKEQLLEDLEALEQMREQMEQMREEQEQLLTEEQRQPEADALTKALASMDEALEAQAEAAEKQAQAEQASNADEARGELDQASQKQTEAELAQREALNQLAQTDEAYREARQAQLDAAARQAKAQLTMEAAREAQRDADRLRNQLHQVHEQIQNITDRELAARQHDVDRRREGVDKAQDFVDQREQELADAREKLAEAQARAEQARKDAEQKKQAYEDARKKVSRTSGEERQAAQQRERLARSEHQQAIRDKSHAERDSKNAEGRVKSLQHRLEGEQKQLEREQKQWADAQEKLAATQQKIDGLREAAEPLPKLIAERQQRMGRRLSEAGEAQALARRRQAEAREQLEHAIANAHAGEPTTASADPPPADAREMSLADLYGQARKTEFEITEHYREVRATDLALLQETSLSEARRQVDVPLTVRPEASELIRSNKPVRTAGQLRQLKQDVRRAGREVESMAAAAEAMLQTVRERSATAGRVLSDAVIAEAQTKLARAKHLADLAREDAGAKSVDLSGVMAQADAAAAEEGAAGRAGEPGDKPADDADKPAPPGAQVGDDSGTQEIEPDDKFKLVEIVRNVPHPQINVDHHKVKPGRRLTRIGPNVEWLYVDSWYIVGPFPNPDRRNIHRQFPPETVIDLDAVYIGAGGKPVRWKFHQSDKPMVMPDDGVPYSIWYAYTQLSFEQAADLWVAVGSDDRSDIWINGHKVWASADHLKAWRIGEGYRKVHFRKGVNEVLYRVENGHGTMGFSMSLHVKPPGR